MVFTYLDSDCLTRLQCRLNLNSRLLLAWRPKFIAGGRRRPSLLSFRNGRSKTGLPLSIFVRIRPSCVRPLLELGTSDRTSGSWACRSFVRLLSQQPPVNIPISLQLKVLKGQLHERS